MIRVTDVLGWIIEPELLAWYKREGWAKCERISQEALRIGTLVDGAIQQDVRILGLGTPPLVMQIDTAYISTENCWKAWQAFKADHPTFLSTITGVQTELSDGLVVGHPDQEITEPPGMEFPTHHPDGSECKHFHHVPEGRWGIIDDKTSKAIQPKAWTQTAKYSDLKRQQSLWKTKTMDVRILPRFIAILRLDKLTGCYEYKEITEEATIQYEVSVFDAYLTCYQHGQRIREVLRQQLEAEVLDVP